MEFGNNAADETGGVPGFHHGLIDVKGPAAVGLEDNSQVVVVVHYREGVVTQAVGREDQSNLGLSREEMHGIAFIKTKLEEPFNGPVSDNVQSLLDLSVTH